MNFKCNLSSIQNLLIDNNFFSNLILLILSVISYYFEYTNILVVLLIFSLSYNFIICISQLKKNILLLIFIGLFSLFLCGQIILDFLCGNEILVLFQIETKNFIIFSLVLSLLILCIIYYLFSKKENICNNFVVEKEKNKYFEFLFLFLFFLSVIFMVIKYLEVGFYLLENGYLYLYTEFTSELPVFIDQGANLYKLSFFSFLCLFPDKRKTIILSFVFVLISMLTLLGGDRGTLMLNLVVLLAYFFIRDLLNIDTNPIITKRKVFFLLLMLPLCMVFLNFFNSFRYGNSNYSFINIFDSIHDFIYNIGGSCKFIGYTYDNKDILQHNFYSFWPISNLINPTKYNSNTIEIATLTNNLQFEISYIVYGARYLLGEGTGGSYIGEIFVDFSYCGIVAINFIYGVFLAKFTNIFKQNYFVGSLMLLSLTALFWAPRDSALSFIALPFESKNILLFMFIFVVYSNWSRIHNLIIKIR